MKVEEKKKNTEDKSGETAIQKTNLPPTPSRDTELLSCSRMLRVGPCSSFSLLLLYTRAFIKFFFSSFFFSRSELPLERTEAQEKSSLIRGDDFKFPPVDSTSSPGPFFFHFALTGCVAGILMHLNAAAFPFCTFHRLASTPPESPSPSPPVWSRASKISFKASSAPR